MRMALKFAFVLTAMLSLTACGNDIRVTKEGATPAEGEVAAPNTQSSKTNSIVLENQLQSALFSEPIKYYLFLPPSYHLDTDRTFPVIYWLHGSGGFPPGMLQGLAGRFKGAMQNGKMPEAIVVFPDGFQQSMWVNSKDNRLRMEDILIQELIPLIDAEYRTINARNGRLVEGGSMGGYGAARLGFKYPELFSGVSMLNPGPMQQVMDVANAPIVGREGAQRVFDTVYGGDQDYFKAQSPWQIALDNADKISQGLNIRLILGENDPITEVNLVFSEHLNSLGVEHELIVLSDAGHNPREMFAALGEEYWVFFDTLLEDERD